MTELPRTVHLPFCFFLDHSEVPSAWHSTSGAARRYSLEKSEARQSLPTLRQALTSRSWTIRLPNCDGKSQFILLDLQTCVLPLDKCLEASAVRRKKSNDQSGLETEMSTFRPAPARVGQENWRTTKSLDQFKTTTWTSWLISYFYRGGFWNEQGIPVNTFSSTQ